MYRFATVSLSVLALGWLGATAAEIGDLQEKAIKDGIKKVAPSIVQIETSGGLETISMGGPRGGEVRKGIGPTSGVIVDPQGYIISSSFNFANKPSDILVTIPGQKDRFTAKVVAVDKSRMLTLLKVDATNLPVPTATPLKDIKIGHWSVALGRGLGDAESNPSVSIGIISALDRIWGQAIQTDAKVSPVNYGGPIIDIHGRVQGILVPTSPRAQGEAAGIEWHDSGIGFAIPLEDINAVLERMKAGTPEKVIELKKGTLGINPKSPDMFSAKAVIGTVAPESPAAKAGLQPNDEIIEIDGIKVDRQSQVMHVMGKKYEGDKVTIKVKRGGEEKTFADIELGTAAQLTLPPYLGILPMRDDPEPGVQVRYVYPQSPADKAGIKAGDRLTKLGGVQGPMQPIGTRDQLAALFTRVAPNTEIRLEVTPKDAKEGKIVKLTLGQLPNDLPKEIPVPSSAKKALEQPKPPARPQPGGGARAGPKQGASKVLNVEESVFLKDGEEEPAKKDPKEKAETGTIKRRNAADDHDFWIHVPENYDPNVSHSLIVWLHPTGKDEKGDFEDFIDLWKPFCRKHHAILLLPRSDNNESGWQASEVAFVLEAVRNVMEGYTIDKQRVVAHGQDKGGELAFFLGFNSRELFRGVAVCGTAFNGQPKEPLPAQRLSFFLFAGGKDPRVGAIEASRDKLVESKYSVVYRKAAEAGAQYIDKDPDALDDLFLWVDSLDRI